MAISVSIERTIDTDLPVNVRNGIRRYSQDGMQYGFSIAFEEAPEDRGAGGGLKAGMFEPEWRGDKLVWGVADKPHALPMEEGTDPFYPPVAPLIEWSERVSGDKGLGFYVAKHKIPEEGIDAQPYMEPGAEAAIDWFDRNSASDYISDEF